MIPKDLVKGAESVRNRWTSLEQPNYGIPKIS